MSYNRVQVRAFLSATESDLFESSLGASCKMLGTADLRRRVQRTRTLRDKSRDLLQRQKLATRERTGSKVGASGVANERTSKKAIAFDEALKRFEVEVASRGISSAAMPAKPGSTQKVAPTATKAAGKTAAAKKMSTRKAVSGTAPVKSRARPAATVLREALDKKEAARDGDAPGPKMSTRKSRAPDPAPTGGVQPTAPSAKARAVASRLADSNLSHIQGHTSTQVRRGQAKRDHKG